MVNLMLIWGCSMALRSNAVEESRLTRQELVQKAWDNGRERALTYTGRDLPEKCPDDVRMILEMADEIAQWRAEESTRWGKKKRTF